MPRYDEPGVRFDDPLIRYDDPRTYAQVLADHLNSQPKKAMFDVALDISRLSIPELIARSRQIITATAEQTVFAGLATQLTAAGNATDTLENRQNQIVTARALAESLTGTRDSVDKPAVFAALEVLATEIGKTATTEQQVESTSLRVKPAPGVKPVPDTPTGLELTYGDEAGELSGQCNGQPGVVEYYEIRYTLTDPTTGATNWILHDTSKKSSFEVGGLPSGQIVWISVRACNTRGKSAWSDAASKRVP